MAAATFAGFLNSATNSIVSASAALSKPTISSSYVISSQNSIPIQIGIWKVERAVHHSNGKEVSIWTVDKSSLNGGGRNGNLKAEKNIEVVRKEVSSLSRLRHPCILEIAEPLEENRSNLIFATESITHSLKHSIAAATRSSSQRHVSTEDSLELDEVEIQKGCSQIAKAFQFIHESAKLVHGNVTPDCVIINAKGDWKLSGFGLATYLFDSAGVPAKWSFPSYDRSLPPSLQHDYDYLAPEYILDESPPSPSNDLYSLGCILHSIHTKNGPPFSNRGSIDYARTNIEEGLSRGLLQNSFRNLPTEVQSVLMQLLTRYPSARLSATSFLAHSYFSSILVSTLRYLERDSFGTQSTEAQIGFLQGLTGVLIQFSDKINRNKVLPSLLEELRKPGLIPFLLPNILAISQKLDVKNFTTLVLPSLKPLFTIKDPPQAIIALLESVPLFNTLSTPVVFREEVMPLVYHALESDNPVVLERALKVVPPLSESLDYSTVKQTLFPKITSVFSKTTMLSVKVNTLLCFYSMIKILDKFTIQETLVPLLAKIKTKEAAVLVATLAVYEAMGSKVDIDVLATSILPQLWKFSITPLLSATQFETFMSTIKRMSTRVELEHGSALAELSRLEQSSSSGAKSGSSNQGIKNGVIDFESLVRGNNGVGGTNGSSAGIVQDFWADESSSGIPTPRTYSPVPIATNSRSAAKAAAVLGARSIPNYSIPAPVPSFTSPPLPYTPAMSPVIPSQSSPRTGTLAATFTPMQPSRSISSSTLPIINSSIHTSSYGNGKPNYDITPQTQVQPNLSLFSSIPTIQPSIPSIKSSSIIVENVGNGMQSPIQWKTPILKPKVVKKSKKEEFGDWKDFDPIK